MNLVYFNEETSQYISIDESEVIDKYDEGYDVFKLIPLYTWVPGYTLDLER